MKKQAFDKTFLLLTALLVCGFSNVQAQQEAAKEIKKEYSAGNDYTLGIDNKYGAIEIVNWKENKVEVVVTIKTESSSKDRAEALLDIVKIEIEDDSKSAYFETEIDFDKKKNKEKVSVSYMVKAPASINVDLENKYGHIYIQEITGNASIELKYGDLNAGSLVNSKGEWNDLDVAYGNASVDQTSKLSAELSYSALNIDKSSELSVESKYSKLQLGSVEVLDLESKYDKIKMASLSGSLSLESDYTQVYLGKIMSGFKYIDAEMTYGNLKGELDPGASFSIDAQVVYGVIHIPDGNYENIKKNSSQEIHGNVGGGSGASVDVSIKYGNLELK